MKRRTFLRKSALYTPVILSAPAWLAACEPENAQSGAGKKVVVIGAGLAGIYAAWLLLKSGYEVVVLEASGQWGGRIRVLEGFADFPIELGAEEIHGEKSAWHKLVKSSGARFAEADTEDYYWTGGKLRTEAEAQDDPNVEKAFDFIEKARNYSGPDQTVAQEVARLNLPLDVRPVINAQVGNEYGTSNNRLSIRGISEEDNLWTAGGEDVLLADLSFKKVIETKLAEALPKIVLNAPVKTVDYTDRKVKVTDASGNVQEADHVIVTVPLPVLRDGDILFTPALPAVKTEAMRKIGMGAGMKIILKFDKRFWPADTGSIYAGGPVPEYWYTALGRGTTPVLTAFVMGENAEALGALGAGASKAVLDDLDLMFGPGVATGAFKDAVIMDWRKEPYIRGAYSYPVVGGGIAQRVLLAEPLGKKVFFAGEATHTEGHSGTMHGAMESAIRAVEVLRG
jgi:monoamine oxidase